ncbi:hypothetical protein TNCV_1374261 [Trichonephila clavipes]|nr:hypothetical protein TNCV_1374261 [Trichonephila clavipes]
MVDFQLWTPPLEKFLCTLLQWRTQGITFHPHTSEEPGDGGGYEAEQPPLPVSSSTARRFSIVRSVGYRRPDKTLKDALFICYKQSPDNAHSDAFSQRSSSPRLIEDETFNDSDIINSLINYEDGQEARFFERG